MGWKADYHPVYKSWHGFDRKQWESLLSKGSSLGTLAKTDVKSEVPEYKEIKEGSELVFHKRLYHKFGPVSVVAGDINIYKGIGKERSVGDQFVGFDTREQGQREVDRVLGIFAKRKGEGAMRSRAPGRRATMLTTGY